MISYYLLNVQQTTSTKFIEPRRQAHFLISKFEFRNPKVLNLFRGSDFVLGICPLGPWRALRLCASYLSPMESVIEVRSMRWPLDGVRNVIRHFGTGNQKIRRLMAEELVDDSVAES